MPHASSLHGPVVLPKGPLGARADSPARSLVVPALGALVCVALVVAGLRWPSVASLPAFGDAFSGIQSAASPAVHPLFEGLKLVVAAVIGLFVAAVYRQLARDKPLGGAMEQAQVLLAVCGALMMIIIGNSVARAFGIAGAASIVRFRTPVDNPKDITVLFLVMALGMAAGMGAFVVAGLGALSLCALLVLLERVGAPRRRPVMLELVAAGAEFPAAHVQRVFARHGVESEAREIATGAQARARFATVVDAGLALDALSAELLADGSLRSVAWDPKKAA